MASINNSTTQGAGHASPSHEGRPAPGSDLTQAAQRLPFGGPSPGRARRNTALIVEGGVMRGAWAAGVLDALHEMNHYRYDLVLAGSSGACTAAYFVADMVSEGLTIWTKCACGGRMLRKSNWLRLRPLVDLSYLVDHCFRKFVPLPVEIFDRSPTRFEIVLLDCRTGRPVYHVARGDTVLDALKATASLPFATRGYSPVNGVPYGDGGLADPLPVQRAIELGATDITVVQTHEASYRGRPTPGWICQLGYPRFPQAAAAWRRNHNVYRAALELIERPPAGVRVQVLRPCRPLPVQRFTEECPLIDAAVNIGRAEAFEQLRDPRFRSSLS